MKKMSKKILAFLLAAVMVFGAAPLSGFVGLELPDFADIFGIKAEAADTVEYTEGNFTYTVSDGVATITHLERGLKGTANVPAHLGGYPVRHIADYAFNGNSFSYVNIPEGIETIGKSAFSFSDFCELVIPDSVTTLGERAFDSCDHLEKVVIGDGVKVIPDHAFNDCKKITEIKLGNSVEKIDGWAFADCNVLPKIEIPDSVVSIGESVFFSCYKLAEINIGSGLKSIDLSSIDSNTTFTRFIVDANNLHFSNDECGVLFNKDKTKLIKYTVADIRTSYTIPDTVSEIGDYAFFKSYNLINITFGNKITRIGKAAFAWCEGLVETLSIPDNVQYVGESAFSRCEGITDLFIGDGIIEIDDQAFRHCSSLESVIIGKGIQRIGAHAFDNCDNFAEATIYAKDCKIGSYSIGYAETVYGIPGGSVEEYVLACKDTFIPIEENLNFEEDLYNLQSKGSQKLTLIWRAKVDSEPFDENDLYIIPNDSSIIKVKNVICNQLDKKVEITVEVECLKGGNTTLKAYYNGSQDECEIKVEKTDIVVYTTHQLFLIDVDETMKMGFALSRNGEIDEEWKKMAVVVSNPNIVDVSNYVMMNNGYYINFTGKSIGKTTVTVTDSESGAYVVIEIVVKNGHLEYPSYHINEVPSFYPNLIGSEHLLTNILDINGLYVNGYTVGEVNERGNYPVTFDVYNSEYHYGSVDVYDANGIWIESVCIDKFSSMPENVLEVFYDLGVMFYELYVTEEILSYESKLTSKKTSVYVEVPEGGYFTITNNLSASPGAVLYNTIGFSASVFDCVTELYKMDSSVNNVIDMIRKGTAEGVIKDVTLSDAFYNSFISKTLEIGKNATIGFSTLGYGLSANVLLTDVESLFASIGLDFKGMLKLGLGITESTLNSIAGPYGAALEACFKVSKATTLICMAMDIGFCGKAPCVGVRTYAHSSNHVMNGVIVDDDGNVIDREAVLQVFRVTDVSMSDIEISTDSELKFDDYITYNICFVKNETEVQPNGKVQVKIPIPEGMDKKSCCVLREEKNGKWTVLTARVEGNYLVFETDHFSLYAVAGNYADSLKVDSMPAKLEYKFGDIIDTKGMSIVVTYDDGRTETITEGFICTPARLAEGGTQEITVSYGNTTTTFTVEVDSNIKFFAAVANPSTTTIKYGDSIILHAEITGNLPAGATIQWSTDNGNFEKVASNDGMTCKITPKSSGDTTITMKVVSADGEVIAEDTQKMTSKAGFFDKLIAFFKKLFGLTKTIPQAFKRIF